MLAAMVLSFGLQGRRNARPSSSLDRAKRTLSAEVTEALAGELRRRRLSELVASYEGEKGAITAKELAAVQAEWLE
jgi:hypothetical protein